MGGPLPPSSKPHQPALTLINANIIPQANVSMHSSPRSIATQSECKLPQEVDLSSRSMVGGTGAEFHASERASHGSMDDLFAEETRGERPMTVAPPGRTYEC